MDDINIPTAEGSIGPAIDLAQDIGFTSGYVVEAEGLQWMKISVNRTIRGFTRAVDGDLVDAKDFKMPSRGSKCSAGYDIFNNTGEDIVLAPKSTSKKISTGVVAYMQPNEVLMAHVRSGHGFKYSLRLANSTGIIDADYNKEIFIKIRNPYDETIVIPKGDAMAQGIFLNYLIADDDHETVGGERVGGFGSTDKKKA